MTRARNRRRLLLLAGLLLVGAYGVWRAVHDASDFDGFHRGAARIAEGTCYPLSSGGNSAVMRYPPWFSMLLSPLGLLPLGVAATVFALASIAALWRLPRQVERLSGIPRERQVLAWVVVSPFLVDALMLLQLEPLLLFLVVTGLARLREGRGRWGGWSGGVLVAVAALVKVLPALLLAAPLLLGRGGRAVLGAGAAAALLVVMVVAAAGPEEAAYETRAWFDEVASHQTPWGLVASGRSLRFNNQGLGVTLARTLGAWSGDPPRGAVRLASRPLSEVWSLYAVVLSAALALIGWGLWRARERAAAAETGGAPGVAADTTAGRAWLEAFALLALAMLAASPLVWTFYFVWLLPAALCLADRPRLLAALGLVMAAGLAVTPARGLGLHMACALLMAFLIVARQGVAVPGASTVAVEPGVPSA